MARNTKAPSMSNPFAPDATKAAIRALTQPMTTIQPEPVQPEPPKTPVFKSPAALNIDLPA